MFFEVLVSLLGKHGVAIRDVNVTETGVVKIDIDFSEHDKVFKDKIELLNRNLNSQKDKRCEAEIERNYLAERFNQLKDENDELKQRIAELENENKNLNIRIFQNEAYGDKKPTKLNLNERVKVKLTPIGAEIYYHQYDDINKKINENCGKKVEPIMPQIDKDGYTEFQLWHFMELYGQHIGICKPNVIEPLDIVYFGNDKCHSDHAE